MKKKVYVPMEITRIKLNPEQAVLSCCDSVHKSVIDGNPGDQCGGFATTMCSLSGGGWNDVSS
ncbi:MAG: hypothetical protein PHV17_04005 [Candidatus Omnitrophica bacterium]|nr:hypothetical protein [Candidatus Omnitrophota bacterium]